MESSAASCPCVYDILDTWSTLIQRCPDPSSWHAATRFFDGLVPYPRNGCNREGRPTCRRLRRWRRPCGCSRGGRTRGLLGTPIIGPKLGFGQSDENRAHTNSSRVWDVLCKEQYAGGCSVSGGCRIWWMEGSGEGSDHRSSCWPHGCPRLHRGMKAEAPGSRSA